MNFHYRTNLVKINDKSFQKIQKIMFLTHFWSIFPLFWAKKFFWKIRLSRTTSYGFLAPRRNLEKTYDAIPRTEGRTDPISWDPTSYHQGSKKGHKTFAAFFDNFEQIFSRFWFQKRFQNHVKNLRQLFAKIVNDWKPLFSKRTLSYTFDKVLNTPGVLNFTLNLFAGSSTLFQQSIIDRQEVNERSHTKIF